MSTSYQQSSNLYPAMEAGKAGPKSYSGQPVRAVAHGTAETHAVHVMAEPVRGDNPNMPLVQSQPPQPIYTVVGVQQFAQKSPRNRCCCWSFAICCCCLLLVGIAIGIAAAVIAEQCANPAFSKTSQFQFDATNTTGISFLEKGMPGLVFVNASSTAVNATITVTFYSNQDHLDDWTTSFNVDGAGLVSATIANTKGWSWEACPHTKVNITLPMNVANGFNLDIQGENAVIATENLAATNHPFGKVSFKTQNAAIKIIDGLRASSLEVDSTNGQLEVTKAIINGTIDLQTSNGKVELDNCASDSFKAMTTNGKVELNSLATRNTFTVHSTNGAVEITKLAVRNGGSIPDGQVSTTNGKVEVSFDSSFKGSYDASTTNGNVKVNDKSQDGKSTTGNVNGGGSSKVTIRTTNGGVELSY